MSNYQAALINIDEIWLKGKNRNWYIKKLHKIVSHVISNYVDEKVDLIKEGPKFFLQTNSPLPDQLIEALSRVPGIKSINPCRMCENDIEAIKQTAQKELESYIVGEQKIRVETKRSDKRFPLTSMEVSRQVGGYLKAHVAGVSVSMTEPDHTVMVRILAQGCFITTRKIWGPSGLPVSTSGKAISLLSGGFDSPAASYLMNRRGLELVYVFFHAHPYVSNDAKNKVLRIAGKLAKYQTITKVFIVPFGELQKQIGKHAREDYRTLLFRQFMVRVAEQIAAREKAGSLVMGDSLGQVSSQTLENISIVDRTTNLPILRPLIGMNKVEILEAAKKADTFDISIEPQDDACAMFAPKHPVIRGSQSYADEFFLEHPLSDEIQRAVRGAAWYRFNVKGELFDSPPEKTDLLDLSDL